MIKPNLWITGLPKAGTSSLFSCLEQHPSICGSVPKETFFLLDRSSLLLNKNDNFWKNREEGWSNFFKTSTAETARYYLEGTTHLFFQEEVLEVLAQTHPGSRFIVLLREPSERIYSSFLYTRDTLLRIPPDITFSRYVSDLFSGSTMHYISNPVSRYVLSRELVYSQYHQFLERWLQAFHSSGIFIGLFEDFVEDTQKFMQKLFLFLELEEVAINSRHSNPSLAFKNRSLHNALRRVSHWFPATGSLKKAVKESYIKLFATAVKTTSVDDQLSKKRLKEYFKPYNRRLEVELGLDISKWNEE